MRVSIIITAIYVKLFKGHYTSINISIRVVDENGSGLDGVLVEVKADGESVVGRGNTANGGYTNFEVLFFASRLYTATVYAPIYYVNQQKSFPTAASIKETNGNLGTITLPRNVAGRAVLGGAITNAVTGAGVNGATWELGLRRPPTGVIVLYSGAADSDGRYTALDVPQGEILIRASAPGYITGDWVTFYVGGPASYQQDLVLTPSLGATVLPAPTLSSPADGANGVSTIPTLNWSTVSGADRYWLMIATSASVFPTDINANSCPSCVVTGNTGSTSHTLPNNFPFLGKAAALSSGTIYYWKVQAYNTNGAGADTQGDYSATGSFTTAAATATFTITPGTQSVNEAGGTATFTVTRSSGAVAQTVYVSTTQTEGFTNNSDYTPLNNQTLSFATGETVKTVTVSITNDAVVESNEVFGLIVQQNSSDPATTYLAKATFTVVNDDAATATFTITPGTQSVNEAGGTATFTVTRSSGAVAQTVYVSTTQTEGFTNNSDYTPLNNQTLSFATGETVKTVTVSITNDAVVESNEVFGLIVQQNSSDPATTYLAKATFTVVNDD